MATTYFAVIGHGRFPVDMLRTDRCYPVDGSSARNITLPDPMEPSQWHVNRAVVLATDASVTDARWSSFGWVVVAKDHQCAAVNDRVRAEMGVL